MDSIREVFVLNGEPRRILQCGSHVVEVAPQAGGRIMRFATEDARGVQEWLTPITVQSWSADAWPKGGSYPLVPFSNRVRDSHFPGPDGETVRLSAYASMAHALHGFGQFAAWDVVREEADRIILNHSHDKGEHAAGRGRSTSSRRSRRRSRARDCRCASSTVRRARC